MRRSSWFGAGLDGGPWLDPTASTQAGAWLPTWAHPPKSSRAKDRPPANRRRWLAPMMRADSIMEPSMAFPPPHRTRATRLYGSRAIARSSGRTSRSLRTGTASRGRGPPTGSLPTIRFVQGLGRARTPCRPRAIVAARARSARPRPRAERRRGGDGASPPRRRALARRWAGTRRSPERQPGHAIPRQAFPAGSPDSMRLVARSASRPTSLVAPWGPRPETLGPPPAAGGSRLPGARPRS